VQVSIVYICIAVRDSIIKRGRTEISLTGLTLPHLCACFKPRPGFPWSFLCARASCLFC
jgi:hypothetical protein